MDASTPVERPYQDYGFGVKSVEANRSWHLPYITEEERQTVPSISLPRMSAVRVSRVSYGHQGEPRTVEEELSRFRDLVMNRHMSPLAQPAMAVGQVPPCQTWHDNTTWIEPWHGNLRGWKPIRKFIGGESGSTTHGTQASVWPWGEMDPTLLEGLG
jgi:hypothetical protein